MGQCRYQHNFYLSYNIVNMNWYWYWFQIISHIIAKFRPADGVGPPDQPTPTEFLRCHHLTPNPEYMTLHWHMFVVVTSCTIWRRLAPRMWTNIGSLNISVVHSVFLILSKFYLLMSSIPIFPMVFSECISHVSVFMLEWKIWTRTPCISSNHSFASGLVYL